MLAGLSGARTLPYDWAAQRPGQIAAPAAVDPTTVIDRVQARRLDRCEQLGLVAARGAWGDAGTPTVDPERLGVVAVVAIHGLGGIGKSAIALEIAHQGYKDGRFKIAWW